MTKNMVLAMAAEAEWMESEQPRASLLLPWFFFCLFLSQSMLAPIPKVYHAVNSKFDSPVHLVGFGRICQLEIQNNNPLFHDMMIIDLVVIVNNAKLSHTPVSIS